MFSRLVAGFLSILNPQIKTPMNLGEETRYLMAYRMSLFLCFSLTILGTILFIYYGPAYSMLSSIFLVASLFAFWQIRKTGKYKSFTLFLNILGAILCQATLYLVPGPHLIDGLWMTVNIIFAFMTTDKKWSISIALLHGITLPIFYFFCLKDQAVLIDKMTPEQIIGLSINIFLCLQIIFYLSWQNIRINHNAQFFLEEAKEILQKQFDTINKQNEEKTMMLKEIHHRVKNNLQVITSLLRLQSRELENEEAISKFRDTTNRVIAMSRIHEKMYQSEELSKINLEEYFNTLIDDLLSSYQVEFPIDISIRCRETLGMNPIVPLALIFNELFSNSLKYAFIGNKDNAKIEIEFIRTKENEFILTYTDNGKWKTPSREDSFGLELISALTEQLDGKMDFTCTPQTRYIFQFANLDF